MTKKEYVKPTMEVVKLKHECHILAGSLTKVRSSGLDDDDLYYNEGESIIWDNAM